MVDATKRDKMLGERLSAPKHRRYQRNGNIRRNNFPSLDDAFNTKGSPSCGSPSEDCKRSISRSSPKSASSSERDKSINTFGSFDSTDNPLDLSIGARAALSEHQHHVARFGIDGTPEKKGPLTCASDKDNEWNRIMDDNLSMVSFSTQVADAESSFTKYASRDRTPPDLKTFIPEDDFPCNESRINSSDYFCSSQAKSLLTPEKNKPKVDAATRLALLGKGGVTERGNVYECSFIGSIADSFCVSGEGDLSGMAGLYKAAISLNENAMNKSCNGSFLNDMSQLSCVESNESKRFSSLSCNKENMENHNSSESFLPDTSFASLSDFVESKKWSSTSIDKNNHDTSGTVFTRGGSFVKPKNHSYREELNDSIDTSGVLRPISFAECTTPRRSPRRSSSFFVPDKENESFRVLALSPIASLAGSAAPKILHEQDNEFEILSSSFRSPCRSPCRSPYRSEILGQEDFRNFSLGDSESPIANLDDSRFSAIERTGSESVCEEDSVDETSKQLPARNLFCSDDNVHVPAPTYFESRRGVVLSREAKLRALGIRRNISTTSMPGKSSHLHMYENEHHSY